MAESKSPNIPLSEMVKSIPGALGIRLEEEPDFKLLEEDGPIEFRRYEPMLMATVRMQASRKTAVDEAFNKLASYIYGDNSTGAKYEMTTPVFQICESSESFPHDMDQDWTIAFVMSQDLERRELPKPEDASISFVEWPAKTLAVYRYSGNNDDASVREGIDILQKKLAEAGVEAKSGLIVAQYDQPFAVPILKRNEVMVEVELPRY